MDNTCPITRSRCRAMCCVMSSGTERNSESTILNILTEDCWRAVLDYLPLSVIIHSESVSRQWQNVMQLYLRRVRIEVKMYPFIKNIMTPPLHNARIVIARIGAFQSFRIWTNKLGLSVVTAHISCDKYLKIIRQNCPNLECIFFFRLSIMWKPLCLNQKKYFKKLQHVKVYDKSATDKCINQLIGKSSALKELEIESYRVTGQCLINIVSTNLKSLTFRKCKGLNIYDLLSTVDQLQGLTTLELDEIPKEVYDNVHLLLHKTSNLENFVMRESDSLHEREHMNENFIVSLCRLSKLRSLVTDYMFTDEEVEALTRSCKKLRYLEMTCCTMVTSQGLAAVCRHVGSRLIHLRVSRSLIRDIDILNCIRMCPNLVLLEVTWCPRLTAALPVRVATIRRKIGARCPLRLCAANTVMHSKNKSFRSFYNEASQHRGVILDFAETEQYFLWCNQSIYPR